jgi:DNA polymerase-3 subunit beta
MKIKINRAAMVAAVAAACGVVNPRHQVPALSCALLRAEGGWLRVTCSDGDLSQDRWVEAAIEVEGSVLVPAVRLKSAVDCVAGEDVELELVPTDVLKISAGEQSINLRGLPSSDFPADLALEGEQSSAPVAASALKRVLKLVGLAMSDDISRVNLCGALLSFEPGKLTAVASDGRRLNRVECPAGAESGNWDALVPAKAIKAILAALPDGDEDVTISASDRAVSMQAGTVLVTGKLLEGKFPDFSTVLTGTEHEVELPRERLLAMCKAADSVTSEKFCFIRFELAPGVFVVASESPEFGTAYSQEPVEFDGPAGKIAFGPRYVLEPLAAAGDERVRFQFNKDLARGVFAFGEDFISVVMPMRLS